MVQHENRVSYNMRTEFPASPIENSKQSFGILDTTFLM